MPSAIRPTSVLSVYYTDSGSLCDDDALDEFAPLVEAARAGALCRGAFTMNCAGAPLQTHDANAIVLGLCDRYDEASPPVRVGILQCLRAVATAMGD